MSGPFDQNDILDDASMMDATAMTPDQIQAFLEQTPYGTASGLANYSVDGQSASAWIAQAAAQNGINPLVLLVRVQMEQGLISNTAVPSAVDQAFGCGCEGASCGAQYLGFDHQALCAGQTLGDAMAALLAGNATVSGWQPGVTTETLDGTAVTPTTNATAALYTYTPYLSAAKLFWQIWGKFSQALGFTSPGGSSGTSSEGGVISDDVISRAEQWVDARLAYCQSPNHQPDDIDPSCSAVCDRQDNPSWDPYRSDCSGLVSWSWGLSPPGLSTSELGSVAQSIDGATLEPGDALLIPGDHVVLFKAWIASGQSATFIEEPSCSADKPYAHEFDSQVTINGSNVTIAAEGKTFSAIRFNGIVFTSGGDDAGIGGDDGGGGDGGAACATDLDCNPGTEGSGMICVQQACIAGCNADWECPGSQTCNGGACQGNADPSTSTPSCDELADGSYCGSDFVSGDPGTLYQCANGVVTSSQVCGSGCSIDENGTSDYCN